MPSFLQGLLSSLFFYFHHFAFLLTFCLFFVPRLPLFSFLVLLFFPQFIHKFSIFFLYSTFILCVPSLRQVSLLFCAFLHVHELFAIHQLIWLVRYFIWLLIYSSFHHFMLLFLLRKGWGLKIESPNTFLIGSSKIIHCYEPKLTFYVIGYPPI